MVKYLALSLLITGCSFQVMPDKTAVRQQQRIADALEVYLENRDTKEVKVVDRAELPQLLPAATQAASWFNPLEYKYYATPVDGRTFVLEITGKPGQWIIIVHGRTPKDTAGVTRYL